MSTTASSVTLTPGAGVTVTDGEGVPLAGPIVDGTEFFLLSDVDTTATVTASAEATVHTGRVFVKDGSQRLILATSVDTTVDAEASASWTTPPTTAPAHDRTSHDGAARADDHRARADEHHGHAAAGDVDHAVDPAQPERDRRTGPRPVDADARAHERVAAPHGQRRPTARGRRPGAGRRRAMLGFAARHRRT